MSSALEYQPRLERERTPLAELLMLAGPTIAQMASYTVMQFADTWMLSRLGVNQPTAAGNGGLFAWSFIGFGVGALFCVNTLVSQHYGQKDFRSCGKYLWQGVWFGLMFALLIAPVIGFAPRLFGMLGHEPALAKLESTFFQITVAATGLKLASTAFGQFLLAINRPWTVMVAAMIGVGANAGVNYFLIYGNGGFPAMGVAGAAWGTNIGVTVELAIMAAVALGPAVREKYNTFEWRLKPAALRVLLVIAIPSGVQILADIAAWNLFQNWVIGHFSTDAMAANMFMFRYLAVSFMPAFGISTAVTALVGRYIGARQLDVAARRAHLGFAVAAVYMVVCGAGMILFRRQLIGLFTKDPQVLELGSMLMIFAGFYQLFDAMYIVYNGALRGAGDTAVPAVATAVFCWGITVMGGYAVARLRPDWGLAGPWVMASIYGVLLGVFILMRFVRGKWRGIHLEESAGAPATLAVEGDIR